MSSRTTVIGYMGSKSRAYPLLQKYIEIKTKTFVDVFGGSGIVSIKRPSNLSEIKVYNDYDSSIVDLFKVIQDDELYQKFYHLLKYTMYSSSEFKKWKPKLKSDCIFERAVGKYISHNQGFGGGNSSWGISRNPDNKAARGFHNKFNDLNNKKDIIDQWVIENLNCIECISKYDNKDTLIYCDPPYVMTARKGQSKMYNNEMTDDQHIELIDTLLQSKSYCCISGYENSIYNKLTENGWYKETKEVRSSISRDKTKDNKRTEVLWINPKLYNKCNFKTIV